MSEFSAIDLSELPAPAVVEALDFNAILAAMLADLQVRAPELEIIESDPAHRVLEVAAYRELLLRQRINEAARAVMLAYAEDEDLDNLGAFFKLKRLQVDPGDPEATPPVPPTMEGNEEFRRRIQLSPEGFSTAGPEGAYIYHALSADPDVLDASVEAPKFSHAELDPDLAAQLPADVIVLKVDDNVGLSNPMPGMVAVNVLSRTGTGTAPQPLLDTVEGAVSAEAVRPLTDNPTARSAAIIEYAIEATLYFYPGPSSEPVLQLAQEKADQYVEQQHRLGLDVTLSGVYAALHQPGVQRVELISPASTIVVSKRQAAYCTGITLTDGGIDE